MEQFILEYLLVAFSIFILLFIPRYRRLLLVVGGKSQNFNLKTRLWQIDAIKGISILAVVIIHACYLLLPLYTQLYDIIILSLINNFSRFAIPVFLFSSGLLLKPFIWNKRAIAQFYISKFIRIGIPYILICILLWMLGYNNSAPLWELMIKGSMSVPFYFVIVLFQIYLIYPILDSIRKINPYLLLTLTFIISTASFFMPHTWAWYGIPLLWQYLIFFTYGMLRKDILDSKISPIWRELIWIYLILQFLVVLLVQFIYYELNIILPMSFYNFQILFGFAFIFSALRALHSSNRLNSVLKNFISPLGRISLWIFLLHFPIQETIFQLSSNNNSSLTMELLKNITLTLIVTIPISILLDLTYSRLKTLCKYVIIKRN